jgi:hypothetical protein
LGGENGLQGTEGVQGIMKNGGLDEVAEKSNVDKSAQKNAAKVANIADGNSNFVENKAGRLSSDGFRTGLKEEATAQANDVKNSIGSTGQKINTGGNDVTSQQSALSADIGNLNKKVSDGLKTSNAANVAKSVANNAIETISPGEHSIGNGITGAPDAYTIEKMSHAADYNDPLKLHEGGNPSKKQEASSENGSPPEEQSKLPPPRRTVRVAAGRGRR